MLVVLAHITVVAGREEEFEEAARRLGAATRELERGVRRYEYVRLAEPSTYLATLAFDDYDAFLEHQASAHHHTIAGAMRDCIATLRLERIEPLRGCSPLHPLPEPSDGAAPPEHFDPVDRDELASRRDHYRTRYPLDRATWWDRAR